MFHRSHPNFRRFRSIPCSTKGRLSVVPLLFAVLWSTLSVRPVQGEAIRSYQIDVRLLQIATIDVTESILIDFQLSRKHGIYRIIPVRYERDGNDYELDFKLLSVTNEKGKVLQHVITRQGGDLQIKIGNPDRLITGRHTYRIRYQVRHAVNFFDGEPEVYWNATGNEWPFIIQTIQVRFYPPSGVSAKRVRAICYIGPLGSKRKGRTSTKREYIQFSTSNLKPAEGLTFVVRLPKGAMQPAGRGFNNQS
jgi:hypothetical protein